MNDHNETVALRHYGFLAFLAMLNVMNFVDRAIVARCW